MSDCRLRIYLNDHLAVMTGELELARRCRGSNRGAPLAETLAGLIAEIEDQRIILKDVLTRIGGREDRVKQGAAWLLEKAGRLKFNDSLVRYSGLSRVIELEMLTVTAQDRVALWDTLELTRNDDRRLAGIQFAYFREQSQEHVKNLSAKRRFAAGEALART